MRKAGLALMAYFFFDFRDTQKQHRRDLLPPSSSSLVPGLIPAITFSLVSIWTTTKGHSSLQTTRSHDV